jgi:sarcosine oxidase delta subunit
MSGDVEQSAWSELPIVCPHCGNHGEPDSEWQANAWVPFKLVEEVVRSWEFAVVGDGGVLRLTADASSDSTDWESGTNLRIECMQCFGSFPVPGNAAVVFE